MRFILKGEMAADRTIDPAQIHWSARFLWIGEELWIANAPDTKRGIREFRRVEKELIARFQIDQTRVVQD